MGNLIAPLRYDHVFLWNDCIYDIMVNERKSLTPKILPAFYYMYVQRTCYVGVYPKYAILWMRFVVCLLIITSWVVKVYLLVWQTNISLNWLYCLDWFLWKFHHSISLQRRRLYCFLVQEIMRKFVRRAIILKYRYLKIRLLANMIESYVIKI